MNFWKSSVESMSVNGTPYKKVDGQWEVDHEASARQREREQKENQSKDGLVWALRTRPLSVEEMERVRKLGTDLFLRFRGGMSGGYSTEELEKRFNDILLHQMQIQELANRK